MENDLVLLLCIGVLAVGMFLGAVIQSTTDHTQEIGQMVCDEKGLGEYQDFDTQNKVIECLEKPEEIPFDGGMVRIVKEKSDNNGN